MKNLALFFCFLGILFLGCQGQGNSSAAETPTEETAAPPPPGQVALTPAAEQYPSVPFSTLEMLWEKCDYVDFIFYNMNFSMSQQEKASIQGTLRHIAEEVPTVMQECPPIGRIFFQVEGRNALEADFFLSNGCLYYVFYQDGKKTYANSMTAEGVKFYQNIFNQMLKSSQQQ